MVEAFGSPNGVADTAGVEGDFNDLKKRILKNEAKPMKMDVLIDKHLRSINGQNLKTTLFGRRNFFQPLTSG